MATATRGFFAVATAVFASLLIAGPALAIDCATDPADPACATAAPTPGPTGTAEPTATPTPTPSGSETSSSAPTPTETTAPAVSPEEPSGPVYVFATIDERQYWPLLITSLIGVGLGLASFIARFSWPRGMDV